MNREAKKQLTAKIPYLILAVLCLLMLILLNLLNNSQKSEPKALQGGKLQQLEVLPERSQNCVDETSSRPSFAVYICGAVSKPGVYFTHEESIWEEVIMQAGGLTAEADQNQINRAALVKPQQKLYVPSLGELKTAVTELECEIGADIKSTATAKVELNRASLADLQAIPGIGAKLAADILQERKNRGRFTSVADLLAVKGIKAKKLASIEDYVYIEGENEWSE